MSQNFQRILGINFYIGAMPELLELCAEGRFIVVPAAPALAELPTNAANRSKKATSRSLTALSWCWCGNASPDKACTAFRD